MNKRIYLDHSATTYTKPEVLEEMLPVFNEYFGNPSSIYSYGREAKRLVDKAETELQRFECFARGNILYCRWL